MLQSIKIQNYALIHFLEIDFDRGFTTITGETGAGKSIILGALSLLVGQRADSSVLKDQSVKSVVEATFSIDGYNLQGFMAENDIDYEPLVVIRREIQPSGKSRAFINDTPVNLDVLKDLGDYLIDIHSQHQNLLLSSNDFQLTVVDRTANVKLEVDEYNSFFEGLRKLKAELSSTVKKQEEAAKEIDYKTFLFNELEAFKMKDGEQEELEQELEKLTHVEELRESYGLAHNTLLAEQTGAIDSIQAMLVSLQKTRDFFFPSGELSARVESTLIELKDVANEVSAQLEKIEADPERTQAVSKRLDTLYTLQQKHQVKSVAELIEVCANLRAFLQTTASYQEKITVLKNDISVREKELDTRADALFDKRKKTAQPLAQRIEDMLKNLGMPNAKFEIRVIRTADLRQNGSCEVQFMFSANKNASLQPVTEVASGGELSRIMLCLKAEMSGAKTLPTIVFDEIDTGVSGDIASKMASIMQAMSQGMQVICITHLPQIASKGHQHLVVYKIDQEHSTSSNIKKLDDKGRVVEIAKMLSGQNLTDAAVENARELLKNN